MKKIDKDFVGNELDDSLLDEPEEIADADPQEEISDGTVKKASDRKRKYVLGAAVGLCAVAFVSYIFWGNLLPKKKNAPIVRQIPMQNNLLFQLNSFVIPHNGNTFNYLSLNVSIRVEAGAIKTEMERKRDILRGKIYDLLEVHINQKAHIPSLKIIKDIVEKGVNDTLSEEKIGEFYITRFLII